MCKNKARGGASSPTPYRQRNEAIVDTETKRRLQSFLRFCVQSKTSKCGEEAIDEAYERALQQICTVDTVREHLVVRAQADGKHGVIVTAWCDRELAQSDTREPDKVAIPR